MKTKNEFKSSQAYIRILILCFGFFFSSSAFSLTWYDLATATSKCSSLCSSSAFDYACELEISTVYRCRTYNIDGDLRSIYTWSIADAILPDPDTILICESPKVANPDGSKTCITVPFEISCWDGSTSVGGVCPSKVTCQDGSEHVGPYICPSPLPACSSLVCSDSPQECVNGDGSAGSVPACPLPYQCWDGSYAVDAEACPWPDVLCDDGSTAPDFDSCPSGTGQVICKDGSLAPTQNDCPTDGDGGSGDGGGSGTTTTTTSPDGTKTSVTTKPDGTKITTVTKPDGSSTTTTVSPDGTTTVTTTPATGIEWINCPDGSKALTYEMCFVRDTEPPTGDNATCWDGSTAPDLTTCPVQINCPDGSSIHEGEDCPLTVGNYPACEDTIGFCTDSGKCSGAFGDENVAVCDNFEPIEIDPDEPVDPVEPPDKPLDPVDAPTDDPEFDKPTDDPCANGACDGTQTEMPKDYARESTAQAIVNVNKSIGNLVEDIRFKELASMIAYLNDSTNSLESIKEYEKLNFAKFKELTKELGLQGLNDQQFYDLITKKTDQSNRSLADISKAIDWQNNKLAVNDQLKINELKNIKAAVDKSTEEQENQTFLLSKLADSLSESSDNSDELIASLGDIQSTLDGALKDDGSSINLPSTDVDLGTDDPDFSRLDNMRDDIQNITSDNMSKLMDTNELTHFEVLLDAVIPGVSSLYSTLPSTSCTQEFTQPFTIQGTTRIFSLDVCGRLADLKLALAWIFGWYAMRTAFNNIFAPKGS